MNITGFFNKHIGGRSTDYTALDGVSRGMPNVAVGAGIGAAAGTVVGAAVGMHSLVTDQVDVVTQRTEFLHPELKGAQYIPQSCTTQYTYDDKGDISGWYENCSPDYFNPLVENRPTGLIEERRTFTHTNWLGPISGALIGMGTGLLAGAVIGGLAGKLKSEEDYGWNHDYQASLGVGNKSPLVGAAAGAAVGGAAGFAAGTYAQSKAQDIVESIRTPITVDQRIGWVPSTSDYSSLRPSMDQSQSVYYNTEPGRTEPFSGRTPVVRPVPTGEYREHTVSSRSYTLTPLKGALVGAGIGAAVGGLTGVAVGVLQKQLAEAQEAGK